MSVVTLLDVKVLNNPAGFADPYQFEITFESLEQLQKDLEWKLTYVGSAQSCVPDPSLALDLSLSQTTLELIMLHSAEHDQELDSLDVGPVPVGTNKFVFEADPPNTSNIPSTEILGVTVILLTCSYDGREFVRVGYYVNNEYTDPELAENPPAKPVMEKIKRNILAEKPRVTRFAIKWDTEASAPPEFPPEQPEADAQPDDEAAYAADEAAEEDAEEAVAIEGAAAEIENGEDAEMADGDAMKVDGEDDAASDAGSEDLEAESSGSEVEDEEGAEEEEEGADEGMEVDEPSKPATGAPELMAH
jgi:histone chaperone ASF1